ncbi:hypothetical protein BDZ89DRAFT_1057465, partial [Hymenopellis radicata]
MVSYIVDNNDRDISYLCSSVHFSSLPNVYRGTLSTTSPTSCDDAWFTYSFNGQGAKVMAGFSAPRTHAFSVNGTLTIDNNMNVTGAGEISFDSLPDGEHTLTYSTLNASLAPMFDYLVIEAGENTEMRGRTVLVDDMLSDIKYTGIGWKVVNINSVTVSDVYETTAHITETVGDSLSMKFRGSSVALYAVIPRGRDGNMTLRYNVDNGPAIEVVAANSDLIDLQMFPVLQEDLKDDDVEHLLTVNVTAVTESFQLAVDFIAYNATFERIGDLDTVPVSSSTTTHKQSHTGAIVGGVVGGLCFIGLVMLGLYIMRNRRARRQRTSHAASAISRHLNWRRDVKTVPAPETHSMSVM